MDISTLKPPYYGNGISFRFMDFLMRYNTDFSQRAFFIFIFMVSMLKKSPNFKGNGIFSSLSVDESLFPLNVWRNDIVHHPKEPMIDWG